MIDEAKRWKEILDKPVEIKKPIRIEMTMLELIEWLEGERGFLRRVFEAAFLAQYQRVQDVVTKARTQYAKNHYCGGNCSSCGEFSCDVCAECPEVGLCEKAASVICDRDPLEMVKYADALADWVYDKKKGVRHIAEIFGEAADECKDYEVEVKLHKTELDQAFKEYGTGKYYHIEDTPTFRRLWERVHKAIKEAADDGSGKTKD